MSAIGQIQNRRLRAAIRRVIRKKGEKGAAAKNKLTRSDLAEAMGYEQPAVTQFLLGKNGAKMEFACSFARVVRAKHVFEIIGYEVDPPPPSPEDLAITGERRCLAPNVETDEDHALSEGIQRQGIVLRLRFSMAKRRWSKVHLARASGLSKERIFEIKNTGIADPAEFVAICAALEINLAWLLEGEKPASDVPAANR